MTGFRFESILDNDFYKFTMQHAVIKLFPNAKAKYKFINRGNHTYPENFAEVLRQEIKAMEQLSLSTEEKEFLRLTCPYLDPTYLDFLQGYRYDSREIEVSQQGAELVVIISGYWYRTIMWEVPVMSLICELYYQMTGQQRVSDGEVSRIASEKIRKYQQLGITLADFGTRRRHSFRVHDLTIAALKAHGTGCFIGTSNVHLAMKHKTKPLGTHAHEWFMYHAAKYGYKMANAMGLENWSNVYRGDLGIALSDTYTSEVFFSQFDKKFTKLFDGVRHDSGDPLEFAEMTIRHYQHYGVDPRTKTIIFSDGLNYEKVERIANHCRYKIGMSFGIGTNFTNDVGLEPMNIVIKMTDALPEEGRWRPVIKLSDEKNKHTGEIETIELAKKILEIKD